MSASLERGLLKKNYNMDSDARNFELFDTGMKIGIQSIHKNSKNEPLFVFQSWSYCFDREVLK